MQPNEDLWCHLASRCTDPDCWLIDRGRNYWELKYRRKLDQGRIRSGSDLDPDHLRADDVDRLHVTEHLRDAFESGELRIEYRGTVPYTTRARQPRASTTRISINNPKEKFMAQTRVKTDSERRADREKTEQLIRTQTRRMEIANYRRVRDVTALSDTESRDCALRMLEDRDAVRVLSSSRAGDELDKRFRDDPAVARLAILGEHPAYRSGFQKMMTKSRWQDILTPDERHAILQMELFQESRRLNARAMGEATTGIGGAAVPPMIDPTILFSDYENPNMFLRMCHVVDMPFGNEWKGITTPGTGWAFDSSEGAEAPDASLTSLGQPSIPLHTAKGVVQYSIEVGEDYPGFATEFSRVLSVEYDELLVSKFTNGSGTNEPTGIITALAAASPTVLVTSAVSGAFSDTDVVATWAALPGKYRQRAVWMAEATVANQIRLASKLYHAGTVVLDPYSSEIINGRPLVENAYMPVWTSTTGTSNRLIVGAWDRMVIARRVGMTVELIPTMANTANNRPDGTRSLFAYSRIGSDVTTPAAFRMQANT